MFELDKNVQGVENWTSNVRKIADMLTLTCFDSKELFPLEDVKLHVNELRNNEWQNEIKLKPKLRFYTTFKLTLGVERYILYNLTPSERSIMSQLRFGILPINIESGRFRNIPSNERYCPFCVNTVEDENHFLWS